MTIRTVLSAALLSATVLANAASSQAPAAVSAPALVAPPAAVVAPAIEPPAPPPLDLPPPPAAAPIENDLLTPSMKFKRRDVLETHRAVVDDIYASVQR